jgi:hypothetical protein
MATLMGEYREAIGRLPEGATLIVQRVGWDEYERLLDDLIDRPDLRLSYDRGRLEVTTPLESTRDGQTAALHAFRRRLRSSES